MPDSEYYIEQIRLATIRIEEEHAAAERERKAKEALQAECAVLRGQLSRLKEDKDYVI